MLHKTGLVIRQAFPKDASPHPKAVISCSAVGCSRTTSVNLKSHLPEVVLDRKIRQRGWQTDPYKCPQCVALAAARHGPVLVKPDAVQSEKSVSAMRRERAFQLVKELNAIMEIENMRATVSNRGRISGLVANKNATQDKPTQR